MLSLNPSQMHSSPTDIIWMVFRYHSTFFSSVSLLFSFLRFNLLPISFFFGQISMQSCGVSHMISLRNGFFRIFTQLTLILQSPSTETTTKLRILEAMALRYESGDHFYLLQTQILPILHSISTRENKSSNSAELLTLARSARALLSLIVMEIWGETRQAITESNTTATGNNNSDNTAVPNSNESVASTASSNHAISTSEENTFTSKLRQQSLDIIFQQLEYCKERLREELKEATENSSPTLPTASPSIIEEIRKQTNQQLWTKYHERIQNQQTKLSSSEQCTELLQVLHHIYHYHSILKSNTTTLPAEQRDLNDNNNNSKSNINGNKTEDGTIQSANELLSSNLKRFLSSAMELFELSATPQLAMVCTFN